MDDHAFKVDAVRWARSANPGDYLARYEDTEGPDPGSRCGYFDSELSDAREVLRRRGLRLEADDRGLVARRLVSE